MTFEAGGDLDDPAEDAIVQSLNGAQCEKQILIVANGFVIASPAAGFVDAGTVLGGGVLVIGDELSATSMPGDRAVITRTS
jgi:hypothetical protein